MKLSIIKSIALALISVSLWSCEKDETQVVADVSPAGQLTASATTLNLTQANQAKPAVTLAFPAATVTGYTVPVTSTIQFDVKGNNFSNPKEYVVATTTFSPTTADFNNMLLALGIKVGEPAQIDVRLKSGAAINAMTFSNVVTLSATPYLASAWIYAPGAYQGWNPSTADSLVSTSSNGIYQGVINFPAGSLDFKITPEKKWDVAYGDAGAGSLSTSGGNLNVGTAGLKLVTADMNKKTWTVEKFDSWGLIGSATAGGWDADTDMKFINDGKNTWKLTTTLTSGDIKFRMNDAWDVNLGGSNGTLTAGGGNIAVAEAGKYTVTLSLTYDSNKKVTGGTYNLVKN
ncbi:SusF/SusE family outer membrane protein [Pedobacter sp. HMF7647]|uniref:SusF/SusE family outer membrane protein n=1 Tax=Hufsiella arboris TaxID=2695275 RepID=A0A7K1Y8R1_9SPHI|nr:SusE domain-containing protein [Hufsiella arboris]MXV50982.1 SusF/SusE family outer membrane protein [Hufsiella arboris]